MICVKRLRRIAWYGLVMLSALLWVLTLAVWTRGGWADNSGRLHQAPFLNRWGFSADGSRQRNSVKIVQFVIVHYPINKPSTETKWGLDGKSGPALDVWMRQHGEFALINRLGFRVSVSEVFAGMSGDPATAYGTRLHIISSYWGLIVLLSILPVIAAISYAKTSFRQSKPLFACKSCGYDLRATPDCCPECGRPVQES